MIERSRVVELFRQALPSSTRSSPEPRVFSAPGRVNLIGEHTDYNEGFVLPIAIEHRTYVAATPRTDRELHVCSAELGERRVVRLDARGSRSGSWLDYVEGTARSLEARGLRLRGADMLVTSDVPPGAGLSSSAALEVSVGRALSSLASDDAPDRLTLALAGQQAEHDWVGTKCGLMDQYIAAFGEEGHAVLLDCRSREGRLVRLDLRRASIVVFDSRVKHDLATSAYNQRRAECEEGVRAIAAEHPEVKALRDVSEALLRASEGRLDPRVLRRCRHVVRENQRALEAVDAFGRGDLPRAGALMVQSHESLRDDYEVSCAELDFLVERACAHSGVTGARMTGGGFGGCVVGIADTSALDDLVESVTAAYARRFGKTPHAFVTRPSAGAREE